MGKKKYGLYSCKECEDEFIVSEKVKKTPFCPNCGEAFAVERLKNIWLERSFNYKRPWTREEDESLLIGYEAGFNKHEIAEGLKGRSAQAVRNRYYQLGKNGVFGVEQLDMIDYRDGRSERVGDENRKRVKNGYT